MWPLGLKCHVLTSRSYSITSVARSRIDGGTARSSALAVLRFRIILSTVKRSLSRFDGFLGNCALARSLRTPTLHARCGTSFAIEGEGQLSREAIPP